MVFIPDSAESDSFTESLKTGVDGMQPQTILTSSIAGKYASAVQARTDEKDLRLAARSIANEGPGTAQPVTLYQSDVASLLGDPRLAEEVFGPTTLLVVYHGREEMLAAANALEGHLTATIHGTAEDLAEHRDLIAVLESKVGRLLFNGFPTGVEVCHADGAWRSLPLRSSDGSCSTSVGTQAIFRFARPFCYQDFPDSALPPELKNGNPLRISRMLNGTIDQG